MPKLIINDKEVEVPEGFTVLQGALIVDQDIPVFCFQQRLQIAGNCRMCLVEMKNSPKPIASCAMPAGEGMVIYTQTEMVKKARQGVLEFLLINHPLDCPICDQGGECDLQDITMAYGPAASRFNENKRAVSQKQMGPLVKTFMTRCIHCTRCIRFAKDVAGIQELGAVGRGEDMEITTFLDQAVTSELSGNLVDLCPVGALTSAPYAFKGRPWELTSIESIDVLDAVGSNIRIDTFNMKVMRILPRLNEEINEEWISDKTRYAVDGLLRQRLDRPYIRKEGRLVSATWDEAFLAIKQSMKNLKGSEMAAIAGDLVDVESALALKELMNALGCVNLECRQDGAKLDPKLRSSYLFNTTFARIEEADFCLVVGANLRVDAPLVAARLHKRSQSGALTVAYLGGALGALRDFTYSVHRLGDEPKVLDQILSGTHEICAALKKAKNPMIIVGMEALTREDGGAILSKAREIADAFNMVRENWNGFNVLHKAGGRVGALDIGFAPGSKGLDLAGILNGVSEGSIKLVYLLGADEVQSEALEDAFVIYQGHHGDRGAHRADIVLPGAAYTEKEATYVNTEGRVQRTSMALHPPGDAKEDWRIIRALSEVLDHKLPYDTLRELRQKMEKLQDHFCHLDHVERAVWGKFGTPGKLSTVPFSPSNNNFYMTDPISRHSETMARCQHDIDGMFGGAHD